MMSAMPLPDHTNVFQLHPRGDMRRPGIGPSGPIQVAYTAANESAEILGDNIVATSNQSTTFSVTQPLK